MTTAINSPAIIRQKYLTLAMFLDWAKESNPVPFGFLNLDLSNPKFAKTSSGVTGDEHTFKFDLKN